MSRQIIKKDNGKYAVWSTITDDFILDDCSKTQLKNFYVKEVIKSVHKHLKEIFISVDAGKPNEVYFQFAMTYEKACKLRDEIHNRENE